MAGITLAQMAQVETEPLKKGVIMNIIRDAPLMSVIPFENVKSLNVIAIRWEKLPTGGTWRKLNEGYTSAEDGQVGQVYESLYGFGADITFDNVLGQLQNYIVDPVQNQIEMKIKALTYDWKNCFINGDHATDENQFEGLKKRVAAMPTRQTIYAASSSSAGLDPTASAANARAYLDKFDEAWYKCNSGNVSAIFCNEGQKYGLARVMRYLQTAGNFLSTTTDVLGREILTFKGKPLFDVGFKADQTTEIITDTEVGGDSSANTSSIYFCSFDKQEGVYGIQLDTLKFYDPLNGGEMESKPSKMKRIDWWNGLASFGSHGITRMRNIKAAGSWT